ncbi:MAG: hypothetical protein KJ069_07050, partial [Anaerolineae bacterium]|nr:hypothetical protein [Anaerolineae bacterium]
MQLQRSFGGFLFLLILCLILGCGYLLTLMGTCQSLDVRFGLSGCKVVTDIRGSELAYSDSGEKFYVLSDGVLQIWDAKQLRLISQVSQWHVRWASISPDELMFLSSNGKELILWDLLNGQQLDSLPVEAGRIDFLTDDTIVVNNHADVTTQLWDLPAQDVYVGLSLRKPEGQEFAESATP